MRKSGICAVLGMVTACALVLSACGQGASGAGNTAGQAGSQEAASGESGQQDGPDQDNTGTAQGNAGNTATGSGTSGAEQGTALIPLLLNEETNALAIGTYEWGGRIVTDAAVRHDALEARLRSVNAERNASGGNESVYVTRSDEAAVSLVVCAKDDTESAGTCQTYVLNPETGKDLRLTDVVTDTDAFVKLLRETAGVQESEDAQNAEEQKEDQTEEDETRQGILAAYATDEKLLEMAQKNWTLDYDGVTVYPQNVPVDEVGNAVCITVRFNEHEEIFQEAFTAHPGNYMIQMLPGRTYAQIEGVEAVRIDRKPVTDTGKAPQYPYLITMGEDTHEVSQVRNYPALYLVYLGGQGFVLEELPQLGTDYLPDSHVMNRYSLPDIRENGKTEGELVRYGLADHGALDPGHLRLYDDTFYDKHPEMTKYAINGYAYYAMTADGGFVQKEDFWYLDGPERTAARQVDTLGYRLYDTESLVSKQITRDMQIAPYRTDGETYFEFAGNGDVFRFDIEGLDENAKLNGTYTFDMLFGT